MLGLGLQLNIGIRGAAVTGEAPAAFLIDNDTIKIDDPSKKIDDATV
tara:strand:+ start:1486 stop:1626 length:141 start_codon:yes stop_codon:yes gene_type:complete